MTSSTAHTFALDLTVKVSILFGNFIWVQTLKTNLSSSPVKYRILWGRASHPSGGAALIRSLIPMKYSSLQFEWNNQLTREKVGNRNGIYCNWYLANYLFSSKSSEFYQQFGNYGNPKSTRCNYDIFACSIVVYLAYR